jgi:hypothetical protein
MYTLKRIVAYGIDLAIIYGLGALLTLIVLPLLVTSTTVTGESTVGVGAALFSMAMVPLSYGGPVLLLGSMEGLLGWTPGKLLLFLRVHKAGSNRRIGIGQGILRQVIKTVALSFMLIGALWALYGMITEREAFYDEWLRIEVEDLQGLGLTSTQRNWRKEMRK